MYRIIEKHDKRLAIMTSLLISAMMLGAFYKFGDNALILFIAALIASIACGAILIKPYSGIFLIALLIPFESFQALPGAGLTASKLLGVVTLFAMIIHILSGKLRGVVKSPLDLPVFCFLALCALSLVNAERKMDGFVKLTSLISYTALFYLAGALIDSKKKLFAVLLALFSSLIIVSIINVMFSLGFDLGLNTQKSVQWVGDKLVVRYTGSFEDPNRFSIVLLLGLSIGIGIYKLNVVKFKVLSLWGMIPLIISIYFSYSRSAYLSFLAILSLYGFLHFRKERLKIFVAFVILLVLFYFYFPRNIIDHFHSGVSFEDTSTRSRYQQYAAGRETFLKNWITGVGLGNQVYSIQGKQVGFDRLTGGLHCLPFSILVETGVFGFSAFLWLISASGYLLLKGFIKNKEGDLTKSVFLSGILFLSAYLTLNIFQNFMYLSILGLFAGIINASFNHWEAERHE